MNKTIGNTKNNPAKTANQANNPESFLKENEVLDSLELDNRFIIQHKEKYKFTSDAVLLANFAKIKNNSVVADLCSGSGIVGILCALKNKPRKVFMVEMQPYLAEMSNRSVLINQLTNIEVINKKIQDLTEIECGSCDVVTVNPPYKKAGNGEQNLAPEIALARHEIALKLTDVIKCASQILKFGGKLYMVHDANRVAEIIEELALFGLKAKKLLFTQSHLNTKANLVLIEASKGGKHGVEVLPVLITNNTDGTYNHDLLKYII